MTLLHIVSGVLRVSQKGKELAVEEIRGQGIGEGDEFFVVFPPICVGASWYFGFASGHVYESL
mgnify:FL=1